LLEVLHGAIVRHGLGFDQCDVGLLLNIASDRLGEPEIQTLEQLVRCKTLGVDAVRKVEGYCVPNAG